MEVAPVWDLDLVTDQLVSVLVRSLSPTSAASVDVFNFHHPPAIFISNE
jgi:hypothetical protein